ncbi:oligosaccharide flippase family protein [Pseudomonas lurida]|uniref:lipopolysaccharide biosynthesis protein n=1 Tax=Pseudomonas lurida TaxID=244566 RepID=UPI0016495DE4|nr:oligosaccharide flippase family protein [Pseudomonas lurida]MBC3242140.1 oligosaccharide flippase family protein [Pseudomonas lurida]
MSLKKVSSAAFIYTLANGLAAGSQLLLLFYSAYVLPADALGTQTLFMAAVALSTQVLGLGLVAAFQRDFFASEPSQRSLYLSTIVWALIVFGLICCFFVIGAEAAFASYLNIPGFIVPFALLGALGQAVQQFLLIVWQSENLSKKYLCYMTFFCVLQLAVPIALLNFWGERWESAVYGLAGVFIVGGLMSLSILWGKGYLRFSLNSRYLKKAVVYGLPLVPYQVAGWGMAMLDRFIISAAFGVAVAGYYALAFQVSQLVNIASSGCVQAFTPWLYKVLGDREVRVNEIVRLVMIYAAVLALLCILGYFSFKVVVALINKESYRQAFEFTPWLFLAMFFNGMYRIASSYCLYYGHTSALAWMIGGVALISVTLNWYLVPLYGAIVASWVSCVSFALLFFSTYVFARCRYSA